MARILVVEDDAIMRRVLKDSLVRNGHDVAVAVNGADALRFLEAESFELVITDLIMPEVEGLQLLRTLRKKESPPKVIAMSGGGRGSAGDYLEMAKMQGAVATLKKPFTYQTLSDVIDRVLKGG